jgi:cellulose 1,4-beta-cellobiosidase
VRAPRLLILGVALVAVLATASIAAATFASSVSTGPMPLSSATLTAPGGMNATANCVKNASVSVSLGWSASNFASGYTVYRATGAGGYSAIASLASGTTSYTDNTVGYSTTYAYYVVATFQSWTAQSSTSTATTLSKVCK